MNESTTNMRTEEAIKEKIKESRFESINGKDLMEMDLPPLHYTISTILPHGFFILAGGAKVGKSWLAEQISYAVASGGQIWGYQAIQSEVLYLGLEDTVTRLQSRFEMLEAYEGMENIHFVLKANSITSGVEEDIRDYLTQHPNIKLVVIDTLQHIRGNEFVKNIYAGDVEFTNILRQISMEFDLTILALTHTNKGKHDDDISKISGSEGMAGGTDGNWVLTPTPEPISPFPTVTPKPLNLPLNLTKNPAVGTSSPVTNLLSMKRSGSYTLSLISSKQRKHTIGRGRQQSC